MLLAGLLLALVFIVWPGSSAHPSPAPLLLPSAETDGNPANTPMPPSVDVLRKQLDAIPQKLSDDDDGRKLLADVNAIGTAAEQLATSRAADLADIDSRLAGLGRRPKRAPRPTRPTWPRSAPPSPSSAPPSMPT